MNILQVIPYFTPKRGGPVNGCYNLSKQLIKRGHEITIITTDFEFDKKYTHTLEEKGVKVIPFHCIANIKLFLISPEMKKWLKREIKNFDIIHLREFRSYQNNIVYYYATKYNVPYILQAHGSLPYIIEKQKLKKLYDWIWGFKILSNASKVFALTNTEAEQCKQMGVDENKIDMVPNGIDRSEYDYLPKRGEFRKKYSIRDDEKVILFLGRIHKIKGIDLLVKAFADIVKRLDGVRLVIVGPDEGFLSTLKRQIEKLNIGDKILFTGPLYRKNKLEAYIDADVYVLPSVYETFPNTVLEACACSTPVIVTNRCGIVDFVDKIGYVVEYDKDQLMEAIFKVLSNTELKNKFGEEGKKLVKKKFTWDNVAEKIERLYLNCIQ